MSDEQQLRRAIGLAVSNARSGGGPFGATVVRDGDVLAEGVNEVVRSADPTAHAEIAAIRAACRATGSHLLTGATLYASTEPCPMCLAAAWWARVERIVFAAGREQAAAAGFDDEDVYAEIAAPAGARRLPIVRLLPDEGHAPFAAWAANPDREPY
jgi:tRNA(Arg) A34 adenosine deaminase TadA